ncbi:inorganic diphosphatase [Streptomyces sp. NPDC047046]|uniref:inorganic diphosphatase n=1 Tax=Streptomyces sp. NPDC047046 TaxID=3155378 RepID=UPI0033DB9ECB
MDRIEVVVEATAGLPFPVEDATAPGSPAGTLWKDCALGQGYVPGTLGQDGAPVDALVFIEEPALPGHAVRARTVALARTRCDRALDSTLICVAEGVERLSEITDRTSLTAAHFDEGALAHALARFGPDHAWKALGYLSTEETHEYLAQVITDFERSSPAEVGQK